MNPHQKKIIIADTGAFTRDILRIKLKALGYSVFQTDDGKRMVDLTMKVEPDLILMDIFLPTEADGFRACQKIMAQEKTRSIPIILLSSKANDPQVAFQYNIWAKERIPKPFSPRQVIDTIIKHLSR